MNEVIFFCFEKDESGMPWILIDESFCYHHSSEDFRGCQSDEKSANPSSYTGP